MRGNDFANVSLGKVAVSFTHTVKAMEPFFSVLFLGEVIGLPLCGSFRAFDSNILRKQDWILESHGLKSYQPITQCLCTKLLADKEEDPATTTKNKLCISNSAAQYVL